MITMIHQAPARVEGAVLRVDRKFHEGMTNYVAAIAEPITTVNPFAPADAAIMDGIDVPVSDLGYDILTLKADPRAGGLVGAELQRLHEQIARSTIVYGFAPEACRYARSKAIAYIPVLEYDLPTQIVMSAGEISNPARRAVRAARLAVGYYLNHRSLIRHALEVHCNGYPIYEAIAGLNAKRLLYLDSRMTREMVIGADRLEGRLRSRAKRALRLIYSGRYESSKGALDAVKVAVGCLERGLSIELDCYGQGSQRAAMETLAAGPEVRGRIRVHDAIPFPDLVREVQDADLFVCCHVQNDPSCTYLETLGAGVPIAGYANRMWQHLHGASQAGICTQLGRFDLLSEAIAELASSPEVLDRMSRSARSFAAAHTFEQEFKKRTDAICAAMRIARSGGQTASNSNR